MCTAILAGVLYTSIFSVMVTDAARASVLVVPKHGGAADIARDAAESVVLLSDTEAIRTPWATALAYDSIHPTRDLRMKSTRVIRKAGVITVTVYGSAAHPAADALIRTIEQFLQIHYGAVVNAHVVETATSDSRAILQSFLLAAAISIVSAAILTACIFAAVFAAFILFHPYGHRHASRARLDLRSAVASGNGTVDSYMHSVYHSSSPSVALNNTRESAQYAELDTVISDALHQQYDEASTRVDTAATRVDTAATHPSFTQTDTFASDDASSVSTDSALEHTPSDNNSDNTSSQRSRTPVAAAPKHLTKRARTAMTAMGRAFRNAARDANGLVRETATRLSTSSRHKKDSPSRASSALPGSPPSNLPVPTVDDTKQKTSSASTSEKEHVPTPDTSQQEEPSVDPESVRRRLNELLKGTPPSAIEK